MQEQEEKLQITMAGGLRNCSLKEALKGMALSLPHTGSYLFLIHLIPEHEKRRQCLCSHPKATTRPSLRDDYYLEVPICQGQRMVNPGTCPNSEKRMITKGDS